MAEGLAGAWWDRFRGRLQPKPCPFSRAAVLDTPLRALFASPQRILTAFDLHADERVLEIGPGTGYYSVEAARRAGPLGSLVCFDIQAEMLREVRRRLRSAGHLNTGFVHGNALHLPFAQRSFDRIVLVGVFGEIPDHPRALAEMRQVLRPGGRLSICEQLPDPDFVTPATLRRELPAAGFVEELTCRHRVLAYTATWRASV